MGSNIRNYKAQDMHEYLHDTIVHYDHVENILNDIKKNMEGYFQSDSFDGVIAKAMKTYMTEVEYSMIINLLSICGNMKNCAKKIDNIFKADVDSNSSAVIYPRKIDEFRSNILGTKGLVNQFLRNIDRINSQKTKIDGIDLSSNSNGILNNIDTSSLSNLKDPAEYCIKYVGNYCKEVLDNIEKFESNNKNLVKDTKNKKFDFEAFVNNAENNINLLSKKEDSYDIDNGNKLYQLMSGYNEGDYEKMGLMLGAMGDTIDEELVDKYSREFYTIRDGVRIINEERIKEFANKNPDDISEEEMLGYIKFLASFEFTDKELEKIINASFKKCGKCSYEMTPSMKIAYERYHDIMQKQQELVSDGAKVNNASLYNNNVTKAALFYNLSQSIIKFKFDKDPEMDEAYQNLFSDDLPCIFKVSSIEDKDGRKIGYDVSMEIDVLNSPYKDIKPSKEELEKHKLKVIRVYNAGEDLSDVQHENNRYAVKEKAKELLDRHKNDMAEVTLLNIASVIPTGAEIPVGGGQKIGAVGAVIAAKSIYDSYDENVKIKKEKEELEKFCNEVDKDGKQRELNDLKYLEKKGAVIYDDSDNNCKVDLQRTNKKSLQEKLNLYNRYNTPLTVDDLKSSDNMKKFVVWWKDYKTTADIEEE